MNQSNFALRYIWTLKLIILIVISEAIVPLELPLHNSEVGHKLLHRPRKSPSDTDSREFLHLHSLPVKDLRCSTEPL
jgi:hypothetical protein